MLKLFQRALSYADPKKLHIALLGIYERGEQYDAALELWKGACRRFRTSCKIWLKQVSMKAWRVVIAIALVVVVGVVDALQVLLVLPL